MNKVEKLESGCWQWKSGVLPTGYGSVSMRHPNGGWQMKLAHRVSYELFVGPIPEGLTIDHLCRNRTCVNPAHLETVTFKENVLRGDGPTARRARQTTCMRGHPLEGANLRLTKEGWRNCRTCDAFRQMANYRRQARRLVEGAGGDWETELVEWATRE
jgi:hypothetical protein